MHVNMSRFVGVNRRQLALLSPVHSIAEDNDNDAGIISTGCTS
jgi:hypothetical protein